LWQNKRHIASHRVHTTEYNVVAIEAAIKQFAKLKVAKIKI